MKHFFFFVLLLIYIIDEMRTNILEGGGRVQAQRWKSNDKGLILVLPYVFLSLLFH